MTQQTVAVCRENVNRTSFTFGRKEGGIVWLGDKGCERSWRRTINEFQFSLFRLFEQWFLFAFPFHLDAGMLQKGKKIIIVGTCESSPQRAKEVLFLIFNVILSDASTQNCRRNAILAFHSSTCGCWERLSGIKNQAKSWKCCIKNSAANLHLLGALKSRGKTFPTSREMQTRCRRF